MGFIAEGLRTERLRRGYTQRELARGAGVSRQSYIAIESGGTVPSAEVALRLASVLDVPVERLFRLAADPRKVVFAEGPPGVRVGARVRTARVGDRLVGFDATAGAGAGSASGVVSSRTADRLEIRPLAGAPPEPELVVAGCDPGFGVVRDALWREHGLEVLNPPMGSRSALEALARGHVHIAGTHLEDPDSGAYNLPWVREIVPFPCTVVSFAEWEQCLVVAPGNPRELESVEDLANPGVRLLNREPGSGSRALLDGLLARAGIPTSSVAGYGTRAPGHMAVAGAIAAGAADAGVAIRASAEAFALDTIRLRVERYDLIVPDHFLDLPVVGRLIESLRKSALRRQIEALGGYDVARMGALA